MGEIVFQGKIISEFLGFRDRAMFKMDNGSYWVQAKMKVWNHFAHHPDAVIEKKQEQYFLTVEGKSVEVTPATDVVDSRIDGEFRGWADGREYRLANGETWKQIEFFYKIHHTYDPQVLICKVNGRENMYLEGVRVFVRRVEKDEDAPGADKKGEMWGQAILSKLFRPN